MTTRPFLFSFAASVAGVIATAPLVLALVFGQDWALPGAGWWLLSSVPLFALTAGALMHADNQIAAAQKWADIKYQQAKTSALAWELKQSQRAALVASGAAGAREAEALERRWQVAKEILFRAIDKAGGASGRKLAGVVGSDTHPALMAFYTSPAGLCILRDAGGNVGHTWGFKDTGELWTLDDVLALNRAGSLPSPEGEPPEIKPLPHSATQRGAARKGATQTIDA